eukprot:Pgem_evm1s12087
MADQNLNNVINQTVINFNITNVTQPNLNVTVPVGPVEPPFYKSPLLGTTFTWAALTLMILLATTITMPWLIQMCIDSYKRFKKGRESRDSFITNTSYTVFTGIFIIAATVDCCILISDTVNFNLQDPNLFSPVHRLGRIFWSWSFSSLMILYVVRMYNFIEGITNFISSKKELQSYFWYIFAKTLVQTAFVVIDYKAELDHQAVGYGTSTVGAMTIFEGSI